MEIDIGSSIKIICSNGVIEGGKLIEFTASQMILELSNKSLFIILDPYKNIVAIKISSDTIESREIGEVFVDKELEPDTYYSREDLRAKSLANLHKLKAEEERIRARELLQQHKKAEVLPEVKFGYPVFPKSVSKCPKKKIR